MANQQMIVVAFIIFFAAVGMQATAQGQDPNIPAAAANIAPAAAAAGVDPNAVIGALNGAAADAAPIGGPIPEGAFKNLAPPAPGGSAAGGSPTAGAAGLGTTAPAAAAVAAASVVGTFFY